MKLEFHILHGPPGAILLDGEHHPIAVLSRLIRVESDVFLGQDVILVVHDHGDVAFVIQGRAAAQVEQVQPVGLEPFAIGGDDATRFNAPATTRREVPHSRHSTLPDASRIVS